MSRSLQMAVEQHCRFVEQMLCQHLTQFQTLPDSSRGQELVTRATAYVKGIREAVQAGEMDTVLVLLEVLEWLMLQIFAVVATT